MVVCDVAGEGDNVDEEGGEMVICDVLKVVKMQQPAGCCVKFC